MEENTPIKILFLVILIIGLWMFWNSYNKFQDRELSIREKELQIKEETYISTLLDQYNRDLQSCFSAAEKSKTLTRDKCIENINNSRVANLLKNWGYSDLLLEKEK